MRKEIKLLVVLIAMMWGKSSVAQSSASATAAVTIVSPVTLSSNRSTAFEKVETRSILDYLSGKGNLYLPKEFVKLSSYNSTITAADLLINGNGADVFALTIPQQIFLTNVPGTERMIADLLPANAIQDEAVHNGRKHLIINAGLQIKNGQAAGRYASQAFDVTVNFN